MIVMNSRIVLKGFFFPQNYVPLANSMIGLQRLVKTAPRISTPTKPFPSTVSSVPPDTSHMERDRIPVSRCQHQVQALSHYAMFVNQIQTCTIYIYYMFLVVQSKFEYFFHIHYIIYLAKENKIYFFPLIIIFVSFHSLMV